MFPWEVRWASDGLASVIKKRWAKNEGEHVRLRGDAEVSDSQENLHQQIKRGREKYKTIREK
jgi:hypothetical protein